jgi:predicted component of type VI protein secretion system
MGNNAVELLLAIEFNLSQALLTQRLAQKETNFDKTVISNELELKIKEMEKTKQETITQMGKLRKLREQLNDQQQKFDYQRWFEREKLKVLSNRHMSLQIKQAIHKRDYEALYV